MRPLRGIWDETDPVRPRVTSDLQSASRADVLWKGGTLFHSPVLLRRDLCQGLMNASRFSCGRLVIRTRITDLLRIQYPILQGAMAWITGAEMAAAVCEAGGLGTLAAATLQPDELRNTLDRLRERTSRPFAVNIPLRLPTAVGALEVALSEEVPIVVCSAGDPLSRVPQLKEAGRIVLQVVFNREMAERALDAGVDALIAMGAEAGGNLCPDELSTLVLVPHIVDSTGLPVVAAGGIADGRGFAAALALGAEGIQMGTRLLATRECTVHPKYKTAVLSAGDTATTVTGRSTGLEFRVMKNELASEILEMERHGEDISTIDAATIGALRRAAVFGDMEKGSVMMGQAAALIEGEVGMAELFRDITKEALDRIQGLYSIAKEGGEGVTDAG